MIDLHTHSTASDGTDKPEELIKKAYSNGIKAIALTDHDTLEGLDEAEECVLSLSMDFVRGCEISTKIPYGSMHILGLWLPRQSEDLQNFLNVARNRRDARNLRILKKLNELGLKIEYEELQSVAQGSIGRPHFAQLLIDKGYARSSQEAFFEYLGEGGKAYFPREAPSPEEAIKVLSNEGAMVFIAHPRLSKKISFKWLSSEVADLKLAGLNGLEALHSSQNEEESMALKKIAQTNNLAISGGSDYHGGKKPGIRLGYVDEKRSIPDEIYFKLLEYRKNMGFKNN